MFAKGAIDMANVVAGALVFGQLVSGRPIDIGVIGLGLIITLALYTSAYGLSRTEAHMR